MGASGTGSALFSLLLIKIIKIIYGNFVGFDLIDLIAAGACSGIGDSP